MGQDVFHTMCPRGSYLFYIVTNYKNGQLLLGQTVE